MSRNWTLKYSLAAVLAAIVIIAAALFTNPTILTPNQPSTGANFAIMLTDPPIVPAGTTVLNLTYTNVSIEVVYTNGTSDWIPVTASGTVDLFSLVNFTKTIASTTIPINTTVEKIQFTIASVEAEVNKTLYPVTALSSTIVMSIANSKINQTLSGILVDFNPTLVQIQATDANGTVVYYYVLVPSATAIVVTDLSREQIKVGTIVQLGQNNKVKLVHVVEEFSHNVTILSASLSVNGNVTTFNVTIMNQGSVAFRVFGLTLHGEFNATRTWNMGMKDEYEFIEKIHPDTIPFKVNETSLIPLFGTDHDDHQDMKLSALVLQPGENATLSFTGVIALQPEMAMMIHPPIVVTPIAEQNYTVRLMGEGYETFSVIAS